MAATDHDTTAALAEVMAAAREKGLRAISGIEITAVEGGGDLHMLGYFLNPEDEALDAFLATQRSTRMARVQAIAARLAALGLPIDVAPVLAQARAQAGRSIGRPQIARAMVAAGYVRDTREAFDKWLGHGLPAFVPRTGATPEAVIDVIHGAGGLASLAHPGRAHVDDRIPALRDAGLDALEAFHPDHDAVLVDRYVRHAADLDLLLTGGSDFHGDPSHGLAPGSVTLPAEHWDRLADTRLAHGSR
jgi:hypothetical protein